MKVDMIIINQRQIWIEPWHIPEFSGHNQILGIKNLIN